MTPTSLTLWSSLAIGLVTGFDGGAPEPARVGAPMLDGSVAELSGRDAVLHCCMTNNVKDLRRLLAEKPDLKRPWNDEGWTFLHLAAFQGSRDVVGLLIENGAEVNARTGGGLTPTQAARNRGWRDAAALLETWGGR